MAVVASVSVVGWAAPWGGRPQGHLFNLRVRAGPVARELGRDHGGWSACRGVRARGPTAASRAATPSARSCPAGWC